MMRAGASALARRGGRQPAGFLAPRLDHAIALAAGPDRAPVLQPANPRQRYAPPRRPARTSCGQIASAGCAWSSPRPKPDSEAPSKDPQKESRVRFRKTPVSAL